MAAGDDSVRSLEHTPTWAVAVVCFIIISISITMEHSIHLLANWFKKRNKTALFGALEKLKSELMLLGFISLFLTVTQEYIAKICIPTSAGDTMLPCRKQDANSDSAELNHFVKKFSHTIRQLLAEEEDSTEDGDSCTAKGKVALISEDGIHQLHIFIFVLALMQIVYSTLTMGLGRAKMRRWKVWEKETQTTEYIVANDPNRFRFTRQTSFGRRHMNNFTETAVHLWIKSFFRQFYKSVAKVDYLTLRHGFIAAHFSGRHNSFNFQQYIQRSVEEDFSVVVGVSPLMWFLVVILLLVDVHDWYVYSWLSFVPLLISLAIGSKLGVIVARMALQIKDQNNVIIGTPLVKPNDDLFWFGKPKFVLTLIHYILFVNAYEVAFVIWVIVEFGFDSCYHVHTGILISRVVTAVIVQFLCSYITLPLYALVTQMGSEYKSKAIEEQMGGIMRRWVAEVRERRKNQLEQSLQYSVRTSLSAEWSPRISTASANEVPPFMRNKSYAEEIMEEKDQEGEEEEEEIQLQRKKRVTIIQGESSLSRSHHRRVNEINKGMFFCP